MVAVSTICQIDTVLRLRGRGGKGGGLPPLFLPPESPVSSDADSPGLNLCCRNNFTEIIMFRYIVCKDLIFSLWKINTPRLSC